MKVALVCFDYTAANRPLQPWRFYAEVADGLRALGHGVTVITDAAGENTAGLEYVRSVRLPHIGNAALERAVDRAAPDICLWNLGPTSALHFDPTRLGRLGIPSFAIFPAPMYTPADLWSLGIGRLMGMRQHLGVHLAGALVPRRRVRRLLEPFSGVIVHSRHTLESLAVAGVTRERLHLVLPGLAPEERIVLAPIAEDVPFTVLYAGSPLPIRGISDLVEAVARSRRAGLDVRLRILSRGRGEYAAAERRLGRAILGQGLNGGVSVRSGFLSRDELRREMGEAHLIALPFQLVPSDMPLAVLEAMSWGRAVLGTRVACMTELLEGRGYLAAPGSPKSLAFEIARAAQDPNERSCLERAALETTLTFPDWPEVVQRVARLVEPSVAATRVDLGRIEIPA